MERRPPPWLGPIRGNGPADDARRFVWDVWRLLLAAASESLQLRELQPYGTWRLAFVADTGTAALRMLLAPPVRRRHGGRNQQGPASF